MPFGTALTSLSHSTAGAGSYTPETEVSEIRAFGPQNVEQEMGDRRNKIAIYGRQGEFEILDPTSFNALDTKCFAWTRLDVKLTYVQGSPQTVVYANVAFVLLPTIQKHPQFTKLWLADNATATDPPAAGWVDCGILDDNLQFTPSVDQGTQAGLPIPTNAKLGLTGRLPGMTAAIETELATRNGGLVAIALEKLDGSYLHIQGARLYSQAIADGDGEFLHHYFTANAIGANWQAIVDASEWAALLNGYRLQLFERSFTRDANVTFSPVLS